MRTLVVYYSRKGHTAGLAGQIAKELGAETDVIVDKNKRGGPVGWLGAGRESMKDVPADIEEPRCDPAGYELVVVGSPVWAGRISTPARAYLRRYAGKFPELAFFVSCAGDNEGVFEYMATLAGKAPKATLVVPNKEQKAGAHPAKVQEFAGKLKV
jgi:menaquinone-dependent protoporphyrinogen IX oxidase